MFWGSLWSHCSQNSWIRPEKIKPPEVLDIYKIPVNSVTSKYGESPIAVKSELVPGIAIDPKPAPEIHKASSTDIPVKEQNKEEKPATKKEKQSPVFYSGNLLLREKLLFKKTGKDELTITIRGSGRVKHDQMQMDSYEIKIMGDNSDYAVSDYPVTIRDFKSNTVLKAGYGEFIRDENMAYFNKNPVVVHDDVKTKDRSTITADEMMRYFSTGTTIGYGHVVMVDEKGTGYATKVTYTDSDNRAVLEGNPRIYEKKNIYLADKMTLYREKKIAILEGNVRVFLTEEKKDSKGREVVTVITGDYAEYRYGETVKVAEFQTRRKNSFVYVSRADSDTYCKRLIARGEGLQEMELFENIYILDIENRTRLYGEYGTYSKQDKRVKVFTRPNTGGEIIHPVAYYYNKNDFIKGRITGEIFDRDLDKKVTYARGNVDFHLYERSSEPLTIPTVQSEALSEWAQMDDQKKEVHLSGRPYLKNKKSKIFAAEIVAFPDDNRLELNNSIEGGM